VAKYVPDITTNRWVIFAESRHKRPKDAKTAPNVNKICVFCEGFEKIPGEEVYRIGEGKPYEKGWKVRVINNKFPITDFHEVIIHSPDDSVDIDKLPLDHVKLILEAYKERFNKNRQNGHSIIFNNVGEVAGASIRHPHSQLVVVPKQITLDTLPLEPMINLVNENNDFSVFCPDFSQWPFEVWIAPKKKGTDFGEVDDQVLAALASTLQETLRRLLKHLSRGSHLHPGVPAVSFKGEPAYNYYIDYSKQWYIRIVPRLVHRAGFELGTGLSVNTVDPADAAMALKQEELEEFKI
jgi:UDPglucose--hexose-1-phosphate uridylyltransferase